MKVTNYRVDDWESIYINEELHYQGHSIPSYVWLEVLALCGAEIEIESYTDRLTDVVSKSGRFPVLKPQPKV